MLLLACSLPYAQAGATKKKISKIVLDAGHGGKDVGARGQFSMEKNLTLAIILKLGKLINDSMKDVQTIYTRTEDTYPSLVDRHEIANQAAADLFVSVHINSSAGTSERVSAGTHMVGRGRHKHAVTTYKYIHHHETSMHGAMVLVLGNIRNNQKKAAFGEYGAVNESEGSTNGGLLNVNDPQTAIIIAQYTQAFLSSSVNLATRIDDELAMANRTDLGVKEQSLEVLAGSYMPGVLVECGFINNPDEEQYLNSEAGQWEIARAIFKGIKAYKQDAESK